MSRFRLRSASRALSVALPALLAAEAQAQQAPASTGSTEVARSGFEAPPKAPAENKDSATLQLSAGGFVSRGNTRTIAATAAGDYLLRRGASQFNAVVAANYGRAAPDADSPSEVTVENYQARARYDHFLSNRFAAFFGVSARNDRFQGLHLRLNVDPGVAYYFLDEKAHRFWAEIGYDFQLDVRRDEFIAASPELDDTEARHNARAFLGYDNQLSDAVNFSSGVEYLQSIQETENARVNFDAAVTSQLQGNFSLAVTLAVKFDNNPLPGVEDTDVITALNLVYAIDG